MKKMIKNVFKLISLGLILCLCLSGAVWADEEDAQESADLSAPAAEEGTVVAGQSISGNGGLSLGILGTETEDAIRITVTNSTGMDLAYFSVDLYNPNLMETDLVYRMQVALIDGGYLNDVADGSAGPKTQAAISAYREANGLSADGGADEEMLEMLLGQGYDGNLLKGGDIFVNGGTRFLYIAPETGETGTETAAEGEVPVEDPLEEALKEFSMTPEYVISFREKDQDQIFKLYVFPASSMETAQLKLEEDTPYVLYTAAGDPELISTLDAEKAAETIVKTQAASLQSTYEDYGSYDYDDSYDYDSYDYDDYDYSYDAGDDWDYEESVYIVYEEYYPSCDDASHGVHYIEYSDGSTEQISY